MTHYIRKETFTGSHRILKEMTCLCPIHWQEAAGAEAALAAPKRVFAVLWRRGVYEYCMSHGIFNRVDQMGSKLSGYGRESPHHAIEEMTEQKLVCRKV